MDRWAISTNRRRRPKARTSAPLSFNRKAKCIVAGPDTPDRPHQAVSGGGALPARRRARGHARRSPRRRTGAGREPVRRGDLTIAYEERRAAVRLWPASPCRLIAHRVRVTARPLAQRRRVTTYDALLRQVRGEARRERRSPGAHRREAPPLDATCFWLPSVRWSAVDIDGRTIRWRAELEEAGSEHRTPVTSEALGALEEARRRNPRDRQHPPAARARNPSKGVSRSRARTWWTKGAEAREAGAEAAPRLALAGAQVRLGPHGRTA